ncbi:MAG: Rieske 2Fe-2S domain-containing protein [Bacteroidia bacterium]|nr:Rieske 2Fe-2S domain-containing protein [Bacteroidia bacterium]
MPALCLYILHGKLIPFSVTCIALVLVLSLPSCTKINQPNVDFTFNITDPAYVVLSPKGGYMYINGAIVAQTNSGTYIAVSELCTHDGTRVIYEANKNDFYCQKDMSTFTSNGACSGGPSNRNLKSYNTSLSGNVLHVWG